MHNHIFLPWFSKSLASLAKDWSEDNLLHSDIALQEDEATGDPFLGKKIHLKTWKRMKMRMKITVKKTLRKTENWRPCIYCTSLCICFFNINWLFLGSVCWREWKWGSALIPDIALNWNNPKLISPAWIHPGIPFLVLDWIKQFLIGVIVYSLHVNKIQNKALPMWLHLHQHYEHYMCLEYRQWLLNFNGYIHRKFQHIATNS